ncbi:hypothetical protein TWF694_007851 [Orbilia ellipsospora]|uniref:SET domain-containing protein n=1 Tax=Orbilia ellipsospora TaxID=2528407 RepID=A0AAV9XKG4_9PEZI
MAGSELVDPTTISGPVQPAFPLTANHLDKFVEYRHTSFGQISTIAKVDLPRGSHFCYITTQIPVPKTTWSSIQTSKTDHIELASGLVYMNHSCAPTLEIEVYSPNSKGEYPNGRAGEFRVLKDRDLKAGEELTFFYPSTEYMSPRPFDCLCGAGEGVCIGRQAGAHFLPKTVLDIYFMNDHIKELVAERDGGANVVEKLGSVGQTMQTVSG